MFQTLELLSLEVVCVSYNLVHWLNLLEMTIGWLWWQSVIFFLNIINRCYHVINWYFHTQLSFMFDTIFTARIVIQLIQILCVFIFRTRNFDICDLQYHITGAAIYKKRTLQWRHNERHGVSYHRCLDCLLKHQSSASLAFMRGIHRLPVNSLQKRLVTRKMFPFDDVIMHAIWLLI